MEDELPPAAIAEDRRAGPMRTCIVTRRQRSPAEMIRFALDPDGRIVPDLGRKLPGRGVWIESERALVERAVRSKLFARAFRKPVETPPDLAALLEGLLERRVAEALSLANKAGAVVAGFTRAEALVGEGGAAILLQAKDASPDGLERLERLHRAVCRELERAPEVHRPLGSHQISLALGGDNVVHAAVKPGGATTRLLDELRRLARFTGGAAVGSSTGAESDAGASPAAAHGGEATSV